MHRGRAVAEVHANATSIDGRDPEEARLVVDTRVEVVNLGRETRVLEDVKSDEGERPLTVVTVDSDVLTVHEPEVGCPEERRAVPVFTRAAAPIADPDKAIEVRDQRRVAVAALDRLR